MPDFWPNSLDFSDAVQNPASCFSDPDLRSAEPVVDALGIPLPFTGTFADVYQLRQSDGMKSWAVKCFTRPVTKLQDRYREISSHLEQNRLPMMVEFSYLPQGILVRGEWFPILKMQWVEGQTLREFVQANLNNPVNLDSLYRVWIRVINRLAAANVAHGDLQHGNMLLIPGRRKDTVALRLIDYDGMWVPKLATVAPDEAGHPAYQHPQRARQRHYSPDIDRFPSIVIACAIKHLALGPAEELWTRFDTGDNLLFRQSDFESPNESALLKSIWETDEPELQAFAGRIALASVASPQSTPALSSILSDGSIAPLSSAEMASARKALGIVAPIASVPQLITRLQPRSTGTFPDSLDYATAIQDPAACFSDPDLSDAKVEVDESGIPRIHMGRLADVYRLNSVDGTKSWAVKCFTQLPPGCLDRYREIEKHLQSVKLSLTVKVQLLDQGIQVNHEWYPVIKMDWVEGQPLDEFIQENLDDSEMLTALYHAWLEVEPTLTRSGIVHGDLQHANILVKSNRFGLLGKEVSIHLIDYDDMWVRPMFRPPTGHPDYQHPQWSTLVPEVPMTDRFPNLVIACTLKCLSLHDGPNLWDRFPGEGSLLFTRKDLESPANSELFRLIWSSNEPEVRAWAGRLILSASSPVTSIPSMSEYLIYGTSPRLDRNEAIQIEEVMGTGGYQAEIYHGNPAAVLFLVDQSESMSQPFGGDETILKRDAVASALNHQLRGLCIKAAERYEIQDCFRVAVIGYGGNKASFPLKCSASTNRWMPISDIASNPLRVKVEHRFGEDVKGAYQIQHKAYPVWLDPVSSGSAPIRQALEIAKVLLDEFLVDFPHCFPPIVVNLTGGEFEENSTNIANVVSRMRSSDGNVLLFNVHFSDWPGAPLKFPDSENVLPDDVSSRLYRMSSILPHKVRQRLLEWGIDVAPLAKAFTFNMDLPEITHLLPVSMDLSDGAI